MKNASDQVRVSGFFKLERDLVEIVCATSGEVLASPSYDSCTLLREVPVGADRTRIPDVVLIYFASCPDRVQIALTYYDATILMTLLQQPATAVELSRRFYIPIADAAAAIRRLISNGLVVRCDDDFFAVNPILWIDDLRIVAIEAKLSRWRDAVGQAEQYFQFADEAYIAVPKEISDKQRVRRACAAVGVGLISVDSGGIAVIFCARRPSPPTPERVRLVSNTIGVRQPLTSALKASRHAL